MATCEVAGRASEILGMDRIGKVGDQVDGTDFTLGSLARVGARVRMQRLGIKVDSDKELMQVGSWNMTEGGGEGTRKENVATLFAPQRVETRMVDGD